MHHTKQLRMPALKPISPVAMTLLIFHVSASTAGMPGSILLLACAGKSKHTLC